MSEGAALISADRVIGTAVYDGSGKHLGTIDSLMLNKRSGQVACVVMSFGGVLGIGERYHPVPWDALTYDEDKRGYNIDKHGDDLTGAPHYSRDELSNLDYAVAGQDIGAYYGVAIPL